MTSAKKRGLGRGLEALLGPKAAAEAPALEATPTDTLRVLPIDALTPGKYQPRRAMDPAKLTELAESIKAQGVMQPILVRAIDSTPGAERYEIVAGERRWRAAKVAGLREVPTIVATLTDREAAEWGVVENLQREDLNTMDRAFGLKNLLEQFGLSQSDVAERVGLDRSSVANLVRLTDLELPIQDLLREGKLGLGHGKALLSAPKGSGREKLANQAASQAWSVRRLERAAGANTEPGLGTADASRAPSHDPLRADAAIRELERQLGEHLGTKVRIATGASRTKGRIMLDFYTLEHFDGLMKLMGVELKS
ncbi:MAG: ParB/RepB/Spo0J family partition protein [Phycisphaerales bacterium]|nr:ParB/RepB/Spo0J family partition protein [Phycisphaerales bacterium]